MNAGAQQCTLQKGGNDAVLERIEPTQNIEKLVSDVDRVERFRLTLRFFDDVSTASWFTFSILTSNFSTTRRNFQSVLSMLFLFSL